MEKPKYDVKVISHIQIENHVEYLVNINDTNSNFNIFYPEKYSDLRSLYELMKKEAKDKNFPQFPPNKLFGYEEENFVIQRAKDLNKFFQEIIKNKTYRNLPSFTKYIAYNLKRNNINNKTAKNQEGNQIKLYTNNQRLKRRAKLFNNDLYGNKKEKNKKNKNENNNLSNDENNQIVDKLEEQFVKIDYDIIINSSDKIQKKYENQCKFDKIDFEINQNDLGYMIGNNNNFELLGKKEDYINRTEKDIDSYIKKNMEKFKILSNLFNPDNFLLK